METMHSPSGRMRDTRILLHVAAGGYPARANRGDFAALSGPESAVIRLWDLGLPECDMRGAGFGVRSSVTALNSNSTLLPERGSALYFGARRRSPAPESRAN